MPFLELEERHADRLIGVWGNLYSAREGNAVTWLNRGDQKVTITVPNGIFSELKTIYKFASASQLQEAKFLLIGTFDTMLECNVTNAQQIAIQVKVNARQ